MFYHATTRSPSTSGLSAARAAPFLLLLALLTLCLVSALARAQTGAGIAAATEGLERQEGYVPFYWDASTDRVLLEIPVFGQDVLYYVSAATGGGSVEMGLDRGLMASKVIHFQRSGPNVLVIQQNLDYRAIGGSEAAALNVSESFPTAVIASLPIVAAEDGRVLVDGTALFKSDAAGIAQRASRNGGSYRYDAARSAFHPPRMKAFPENTEIETISTFAVENAGVPYRAVAADPNTLTLRIHHSFLKAPEGYMPRMADPRIGVGGPRFRNQAASFEDGTEVRWVGRWRLAKKDPGAALSEPVEPIVVYVDLAVPEPIRGALREGLLWWNEAFEAAGFRNAIEVRDPTPDMDPMDARYAWMLWIDRDERGFSSGGGFSDPRTGEILSPKTRMDSHRIRTLANYWETYMAPSEGYGDGKSIPAGQQELVTLRYASLAAHEFGHSLGFGHNWASSINERASVMDYPIPRLQVVDGKLDLSDSYARGIGEYDKFMVRYAYSELPPEREKEELDAILAEMREQGIIFVPGSDPRWNWYDDRATPTEFLRETIAARAILLDQFGLDNLAPGEPVGALRDLRFWMAYLHHRWAIEAGQKYVGGMYHNIVLKGESLPPTEIVPGDLQREVLALLVDSIQPERMLLSEDLLALLTPHPGFNNEDMAGDYAFDQLRAARILAGLVIGPLLQPERAARMVAFADRDPDTLSLPEMLDALLEATWNAPADKDRRLASLRRVSQSVLLDAMMILGAGEEVSREASNYVLAQLARLGEDLSGRSDRDPMTAAHYEQSARAIARYLENPDEYAPENVEVEWGGRPRSRFPGYPGPPL